MVNLGLIGCGTIGSGLVEIIKEQKPRGINLVQIADVRKFDEAIQKRYNTTEDASHIFNNPNVDIVVELIGGYEPAHTLIKNSILSGKHVVTANKAVIDKYGKELSDLALENKVYLKYGASVGGAIPIIDSIENGLKCDDTRFVMGILNGTTNYILTRMEEGLSYEGALKEAQSKGFAESNPEFDVEGKDAAQKLAILSSIIIGTKIGSEQVYTEGITKIQQEDIKFADNLGYKIKLLAIMKRDGDIELRVHPTLIPKYHPLASVSNEINGIYLAGNSNITLSGEGAGKRPTASAVLSDIISITEKIGHGYIPQKTFTGRETEIKCIDNVTSGFFLKFYGLDKPGTLANLANIMGEESINISKVIQMGSDIGRKVPIVMITDKANQRAMNNALSKVSESERLELGIAIRIES